MEKIKISEFEVSNQIVGFYLIKQLNVRTSSNNKLYLDLILQDNSGEIDSKLWNIKNDEDKKFKAGDIIKVKGTVTSWNDNLQFKIEKIRIAEEDEYILEDLVRSAPINPEEEYNDLIELVENFNNETIKIITREMLEKYKKKLMYYPAAKSNHHSIKGGLLYHIKRMLLVGKSLAEIYPSVNRELLFSGIILHDIEKVNEMASDSLGVVEDYTMEGKILGHLIMGIKEIDKISNKHNLDSEVSLMMQHMILSHHYEPEFGSPKKPMFLEAELLHHIDLIDARVYDFDEINSSLEPGEFSKPIWTLDKRRVYKSKK